MPEEEEEPALVHPTQQRSHYCGKYGPIDEALLKKRVELVNKRVNDGVMESLGETVGPLVWFPGARENVVALLRLLHQRGRLILVYGHTRRSLIAIRSVPEWEARSPSIRNAKTNNDTT